MAASKNTPKDALVMATILKEIGISDYEPRVLNQMLEFTYRYVTSILSDSQRFSTYAKKSSIDMDDVRLAIKLQTEKYFTTPPLREVLVDIATQKNSTPLPLIKSTAGPRLPPDRYSLTACNYRLKTSMKKQRVLPSATRLNISSLSQQSTVNKLNPQVTLGNKSSGTVSVVTKAGPSSLAMLPRALPNPAIPKNFPTPIIKFPDGTRTTVGTPSITNPAVTGSMPPSQIIMPSNIIRGEVQPMPEFGEKRKREDDPGDNYEL